MMHQISSIVLGVLKHPGHDSSAILEELRFLDNDMLIGCLDSLSSSSGDNIGLNTVLKLKKIDQ